MAYPEALAIQIWESQEVPRLSGNCQGKSQGWHAEGSIVKEDASGGQALSGWTPLDHHQVEGCQKVVQAHRNVAIEIEGEVRRRCH